MALPTPQQYAQKWATNLGAAQAYQKAGVMAVTEAPGVKAAAAGDRYMAGIQAAFTSGKWAAKVSGVSLSAWQNAYINKGLPRMQTGISTAVANKIPQWTALLNNIATVQGQLDSLPKGGLQNNINRMVAWATGMNKISQTGG